MTSPRITTKLLALTLAAGCNGSVDDGASNPTEVARAHRAELQWKRNVALQRDLERALELPADKVCNELGRGSCTTEVHHIALGGSDPLGLGLYEPLPDTLLSTTTVVDRVVMSACASRASLDRDGDAVVFTELDLAGGEAPEAGDDAFDATVAGLYQRLLSRDPDDAELAGIARLTRDRDGARVSAYDFAVLGCFAIGTSTEFLFY